MTVDIQDIRARVEAAAPDHARALAALRTCVEFYVLAHYEHKDGSDATLNLGGPVAKLLDLVEALSPSTVVELLDLVEALQRDLKLATGGIDWKALAIEEERVKREWRRVAVAARKELEAAHDELTAVYDLCFEAGQVNADKTAPEKVRAILDECERLRATECDDLTNQLAQQGDIDRLRAERDEAFAEVDRLHATRVATDANYKLVEFHNKTVDDLKQQLSAMTAARNEACDIAEHLARRMPDDESCAVCGQWLGYHGREIRDCVGLMGDGGKLSTLRSIGSTREGGE